LEHHLKRLSIGDKAPDFALADHTGQLHRLSDLYRTKHVLLVFNIGFA
jgi:peroxiredoxin